MNKHHKITIKADINWSKSEKHMAAASLPVLLKEVDLICL